jgi:hypothetical protein
MDGIQIVWELHYDDHLLPLLDGQSTDCTVICTDVFFGFLEGKLSEGGREATTKYNVLSRQADK